MKKVFLASVIISILFPSVIFAGGPEGYTYESHTHYAPFYIGGLAGYGNTNWSDLVDKKNPVASMSATPIKAKDDGFAWGAFIGYEIARSFGVEAGYLKFTDATLTLLPHNVYNNTQNFTSETYAFYAVARFMVPIMHYPIRAFADFGPAVTYRRDKMTVRPPNYKNIHNMHTNRHITVAFGGGFNWDFSRYFFTELGFNYIAGYGKSSPTPIYDYMPFLYTVHLKLGYRLPIGL